MSPENKAHFLAEKEAIHLILTGIEDDIYSTVDACQTIQEMWEAIERRRRGVVIRDPEEESSAKTPTETKSKDKGKGIMVEEPMPIKKKQQVELDEAYARKLQEELNQDIDWEVAMDHVKQKAKENPYVQRYQVMKKRPQTEAQARKNMMVYLKNIAGFTLDYFKGMSYDDIRPIFEAKFNANMEFLLKSKEQMEEEESRAIAIINETPAQKATKRRRLNKKAKDFEELKQHLEIVPDEDEDVYTEATLLAGKVPVVDYHIIHVNNKPRYKIIRQMDKIMYGKIKEKIPTIEVYTRTNVKCSKILSGRTKRDVPGAYKIYKTTASRRLARVMVEHILHQAQEQEKHQAS
nr:hypothetical protein [Tanacetum cinerariifolium]